MPPLALVLSLLALHPLPSDGSIDGATTIDAAPSTQDEARKSGDDLRQVDRPDAALDRDAFGPVGRFLLDWGGLRPQLEDRGIAIELFYTADGSYVPFGSVDERGTAARGLLDLSFTYDTNPVLDIDGGTFHAALEWIHGQDGSTEIGVVQPTSSIDAEERFQLGRLWYQQAFEGTRVRLGKIDGNSHFAVVDAAADFVHSSMGLSPTVFLMPTYPDAAFGVMVEQDAGPLVLRGGVFDGALARGVRTGESGPSTTFDGTDDWFWIGEADLGWDGGRLVLGGWTSTADVARFDGGTESGSRGLYAIAEHRLVDLGTAVEVHDPITHVVAAGIDGFLQYGSADGDVSAVETHIGAGIQWVAPFGVATDRLGLGVSYADLTTAPGAGFTASSETAFELYYGFEAAAFARVKTDVQYVLDPGGNAAVDDAWVFTLRVTLAL
ncbi:Carbohydrate-selective porin, OprB family [Planctomycetes bacterium Pla163]|uniref:Carbohydrate-selective porin, OprB family n=1 Tax=Rohdeia mirabilis TaxID=2528008 RepID=A0A518CVV4_9BACT|nr:Carbohydrate-selective porin, OprB family [Planctomycetes bacterium Pla163]